MCAHVGTLSLGWGDLALLPILEIGQIAADQEFNSKKSEVWLRTRGARPAKFSFSKISGTFNIYIFLYSSKTLLQYILLQDNNRHQKIVFDLDKGKYLFSLSLILALKNQKKRHSLLEQSNCCSHLV